MTHESCVFALKNLLFRNNLEEAGGGHVVYPLVVAEGAAVPAGLEPDQGVGHGQDAQE